MRILAGFIVAWSLLLAAGTYTYRTTVRVATAADSVAHTRKCALHWLRLYGRWRAPRWRSATTC